MVQRFSLPLQVQRLGQKEKCFSFWWYHLAKSGAMMRVFYLRKIFFFLELSSTNSDNKNNKETLSTEYVSNNQNINNTQ